MGKSKKDPYTGFNSELAAPTFTDHHGNIATSQEELAKLTEGSDYIENQFPGRPIRGSAITPGNATVHDMRKQFPGQRRYLGFCG